MSTITTRAANGSPLTNNQIDANFTNLNTDKLEPGNIIAAAEITPVDTDTIPVVLNTSFILSKLTWATLKSTLASACSNGWNSATTTTLNTTKVVVASAATPNIFAAAGNTIDYTGTTSCSNFVAAPRAGITRTLICADACKFIAGAALYIDGVQSGKTITLGAGAIVTVVAISTGVFFLRYYYSGTFTLRSTSCNPYITTTVQFNSSNGWVDWSFQYFGFQGTSNITGFFLDQIPVSLQPNKSQWTQPVVAYNSGTLETVNHIEISDITNNGGGGPGLGAASVVRGGNRSTGWTASGLKGLATNTIRYSIN